MFRKRATVVITVLLASAGTPGVARAASREADSLKGFCSFAETALTGGIAPSPADAVHDTEYTAFVSSKVSSDPPTVHQYTTYEDSGRTLPVQIRCKTRTAERLGGTAGADPPCSWLNSLMLDLALLTMTPAQRGAAPAVTVDDDVVTTIGAEWLADRPSLTRVDGALHLTAGALLIGWTDPRYASLPESLRGVHYCTLAAPSYLKRVLLGEDAV